VKSQDESRKERSWVVTAKRKASCKSTTSPEVAVALLDQEGYAKDDDEQEVLVSFRPHSSAIVEPVSEAQRLVPSPVAAAPKSPSRGLLSLAAVSGLCLVAWIVIAAVGWAFAGCLLVLFLFASADFHLFFSCPRCFSFHVFFFLFALFVSQLNVRCSRPWNKCPGWSHESHHGAEPAGILRISGFGQWRWTL